MQELQMSLLGDYALIKEIGEGMLGKVYLAQHRFLKKLYILKVLPEELSESPSFIHRFEKEVAMVAVLDHPHIAKIQNVCSAEEKYFLVYECGASPQSEVVNLQAYLEQKKTFSEEEIFSLAKQIAAALDYAHQKNIGDEAVVHRGLKFSTILLIRAKEEWEVKIFDFGLSRMIGMGAILSGTYKMLWEAMAEQAGGDASKLYHSFSPYYAFLSPEQKGDPSLSGDIEAKADTYAFGVILYFLLMGHFPEGFFPLPSVCRPELKWNWDSLIQQCLYFDPEKRPYLLQDLLDKVPDHRELKPILNPQTIIRPEYEPNPAAIFQKDKSVAIYVPKKMEVKEVEPLLTEMVVIEKGTFHRGNNNGARDEMPRHPVSLLSFAIDVHPITNEQFIRFLTAMGGEKEGNNNDIIRLRESRIRRTGVKLVIESGYAKHPVVGVTWYGASAYAKWVGKRLPTEAEWEVAATGGKEGSHYPTGDDIERNQANFFSSDTTSVMSYPPNAHGIYDMAGNVYEWCLDWYGYHYYETSQQEPDQPQGPSQGVYRVLRGGCWKSLKEDMRCSHRHRNNPGTMNGTYGFRCAADVKG